MNDLQINDLLSLVREAEDIKVKEHELRIAATRNREKLTATVIHLGMHNALTVNIAQVKRNLIPYRGK